MHIWITLGIIAGLDRISKVIVQNKLQIGESIEVLPGFFHITYLLNPGAAFGILSGKTELLIIISLMVIGGLFFFLNKIPKEHIGMRICMGLIGGGALGR